MKKVKKETDEKKYFYYVRDDRNRPIITVCLIQGSNGIGRGISVCSVNDNPVKAIGRDIANRRALKAYWERIGGIPMWSSNALNVLDSISTGHYWMECAKIEFNPVLSERERRMLKVDLGQ